MNWTFWKTPCKHKFGMWAVSNTLRNDQGYVKVMQVRFCSTCGYMQLDAQEK